MYFPLPELHGWGKRFAASRRRFVQRFLKDEGGAARPEKSSRFGLLFQASGAAIAMSRTTSPARISPAVPGTKAELPGI